MHTLKPILSPASLFTQVQHQLSTRGRPAQRRGFEPRPLPRSAPRPASRAVSTSDVPMEAYYRALAYALQRDLRDLKVITGEVIVKAQIAEDVLTHQLTYARADLVTHGFTPRQARRLIQKYRAPEGIGNGTR